MVKVELLCSPLNNGFLGNSKYKIIENCTKSFENRENFVKIFNNH